MDYILWFSSNMHENNNMAEVIDTFLQKIRNDFKPVQTKVDGVLVTDKNGLILAKQGVDNDCSGSITLLSDLASTLLQKDATVCLENEEHKLIVREAGKTVFTVYTQGNRR